MSWGPCGACTEVVRVCAGGISVLSLPVPPEQVDIYLFVFCIHFHPRGVFVMVVPLCWSGLLMESILVQATWYNTREECEASMELIK